MNVLDTDKRAAILHHLMEGCSMRATSRLTGAAKKTVERMLVAAGTACAAYMDKAMRNLNCKVLQVDEVWSFTYAKQKNVAGAKLASKDGIGDTWNWIAIDSETKLVPCFHVGNRDATDAYLFINDLAGRLASRVQLTSDGLKAYVQAVEDAFGCDIDYAQLIKLYGDTGSAGVVRYSPAKYEGSKKTTISGTPDHLEISTSHVERQNLTIRMNNRRFTRLTNAFSKKLENHKHALAIHFMYYNFCRIHTSLRVTPAMAAGVSDHVWELAEVVALL